MASGFRIFPDEHHGRRRTTRTFPSGLLVLRQVRRILVLGAAVAAFALPGGKAAAGPTVVDTHMPFMFADVNPCTGEPFAGSGFEHFKSTVQTVPNFHMSLEYNVESAQATTPSGVRYVVPVQISQHSIIDSDVAPMNETLEEMLQFIRQAEDGSLVMGDDFYVRIRMHVTVNAQGSVTVSFLDFTVICR